MNRRTPLAVGIAVLAGTALFGVGIARPEAPLPPCVQWVGHDSKFTEPGFRLVRDEESWKTLWAAHTGHAREYGAIGRHAAPKIDFERYMVVAYFRGPTTNRDGEVLETVHPGEDRLVLRFESWSFQTASFSGPDKGVATTPYGLWVVPASDSEIVIEEGRPSTGLKADPIVYKEVFRFAGR